MRFSTIRKLKVHNPQVTHPMMMFEEIGKKMVFAHIEWSSFQHGAANANSIYHRILHLFFDITKFLMPYNSPRFYIFCVCNILQPFCWFAPVALMMVVQRHGHTADARARAEMRIVQLRCPHTSFIVMYQSLLLVWFCQGARSRRCWRLRATIKHSIVITEMPLCIARPQPKPSRGLQLGFKCAIKSHNLALLFFPFRWLLWL